MGLQLEIIYFDDDLLELRCTCSNGCFSGIADCFSSHELMATFAATLSGFPNSLDDAREFEIGTFDDGFAGGGVALSFRCTDKAGHTVVDVSLRGDPNGGIVEQIGSARFTFVVEPASVDRFVSSLKGMQVATGELAILEMAT